MKFFSKPTLSLAELQALELTAAKQNLEHHLEQQEYHSAMVGMYFKRIARLESVQEQKAKVTQPAPSDTGYGLPPGFNWTSGPTPTGTSFEGFELRDAYRGELVGLQADTHRNKQPGQSSVGDRID